MPLAASHSTVAVLVVMVVIIKHRPVITRTLAMARTVPKVASAAATTSMEVAVEEAGTAAMVVLTEIVNTHLILLLLSALVCFQARLCRAMLVLSQSPKFEKACATMASISLSFLVLV